LFWKKKKSDDAPKQLFKMPAETRGAFRVYPSDKDPVMVVVDGKSLKAVDISAGGISFENIGFKNKATYSMELSLPNSVMEIKVKVEILKIDEGNICRCKMVGMNQEQEDEVHHYILERQKEELIEKKYK